MRWVIAWAVAGIFAMSAARSATITVEPLNDTGSAFVNIIGQLKFGDEEDFRFKTRNLTKAIVAFVSDGGSLIAGVRIGETIRLRGFPTVVFNGARCASACALAWLGGSRRMMEERAAIGFHAAYDNNGVSGAANAIAGAYLDKIGLSENAIFYITKAQPEGMTWLTLQDARALGIDVELFPRQETPQQQLPQFSVSPPEKLSTTTDSAIAARLARNVYKRISSGPGSIKQSVDECYRQASIMQKEESSLYCIALDFFSSEIDSKNASLGPIEYSAIRDRAFLLIKDEYHLDVFMTRSALIASSARALYAETSTAVPGAQINPVSQPSTATRLPPAVVSSPTPVVAPTPQGARTATETTSAPSQPAISPVGSGAVPQSTVPSQPQRPSVATSMPPVATTPPIAPTAIEIPRAPLQPAAPVSATNPAPQPSAIPQPPVPVEASHLPAATPALQSSTVAPIAPPAPVQPAANASGPSPAPTPIVTLPSPTDRVTPLNSPAVTATSSTSVPFGSVLGASVPFVLRCGSGTVESKGQCVVKSCSPGERLTKTGGCKKIVATQRPIRLAPAREHHNGGCTSVGGANFC